MNTTSTNMQDAAEDLVILDDGADFMYRYEYDQLPLEDRMNKNVTGFVAVNSEEYEKTLIEMGEIPAA